MTPTRRKELEADLIEQWQRLGGWSESQAKNEAKRLSDDELLEWFEEGDAR